LTFWNRKPEENTSDKKPEESTSNKKPKNVK
jgi:hypothetical protein